MGSQDRGSASEIDVVPMVLWILSGCATALYWGAGRSLAMQAAPTPLLPSTTAATEVLSVAALLLLMLGVSVSLRMMAAFLAQGSVTAPRPMLRPFRQRLLAMLLADAGVFALVLMALVDQVRQAGIRPPGWPRAGAAGRLVLDALAFWPPIAAVLWMRLIRRADKDNEYAPVCTCGYSLKGNVSGTCPECGRQWDRAGVAPAAGSMEWGPRVDRPHTRLHRPFLVVAVLFFALSVALFTASAFGPVGAFSAAGGSPVGYHSYTTGAVALSGLGLHWFMLAGRRVRTAAQRRALRRLLLLTVPINLIFVLLVGAAVMGLLDGPTWSPLLQEVLPMAILLWIVVEGALFHRLVAELAVDPPGPGSVQG